MAMHHRRTVSEPLNEQSLSQAVSVGDDNDVRNCDDQGQGSNFSNDEKITTESRKTKPSFLTRASRSLRISGNRGHKPQQSGDVIICRGGNWREPLRLRKTPDKQKPDAVTTSATSSAAVAETENEPTTCTSPCSDMATDDNAKTLGGDGVTSLRGRERQREVQRAISPSYERGPPLETVINETTLTLESPPKFSSLCQDQPVAQPVQARETVVTAGSGGGVSGGSSSIHDELDANYRHMTARRAASFNGRDQSPVASDVRERAHTVVEYVVPASSRTATTSARTQPSALSDATIFENLQWSKIENTKPRTAPIRIPITDQPRWKPAADSADASPRRTPTLSFAESGLKVADMTSLDKSKARSTSSLFGCSPPPKLAGTPEHRFSSISRNSSSASDTDSAKGGATGSPSRSLKKPSFVVRSESLTKRRTMEYVRCESQLTKEIIKCEPLPPSPADDVISVASLPAEATVDTYVTRHVLELDAYDSDDGGGVIRGTYTVKDCAGDEQHTTSAA